ncbi:MAG: Rrf2 family transcriptional regulator [Candidatus Hydrogenedentes bacterium]|nr:Rrf2 family transcriptional regulator [Candidatus Hydrogenedentota bacterium]
MFKLYSKGCEYALRALTYAASRSGNGRFQAKDVCEKADIPESFTRKVFQALTQGGFLQAVRGPGGGYELSRPPEKISLLDVIEAVEGQDTFEHCVLGFPECGGKHPCPLHETWSKAKRQLMAQLEHRTLQDLADSTTRKKRRAYISGG